MIAINLGSFALSSLANAGNSESWVGGLPVTSFLLQISETHSRARISPNLLPVRHRLPRHRQERRLESFSNLHRLQQACIGQFSDSIVRPEEDVRTFAALSRQPNLLAISSWVSTLTGMPISRSNLLPSSPKHLLSVVAYPDEKFAVRPSKSPNGGKEHESIKGEVSCPSFGRYQIANTLEKQSSWPPLSLPDGSPWADLQLRRVPSPTAPLPGRCRNHFELRVVESGHQPMPSRLESQLSGAGRQAGGAQLRSSP